MTRHYGEERRERDGDCGDRLAEERHAATQRRIQETGDRVRETLVPDRYLRPASLDDPSGN